MTGFTAIAAVGKSIERLLAQAVLDRQPVPTKTARPFSYAPRIWTAAASRTWSVTSARPSCPPCRVDFNKTMRAAWAARAEDDGRGRVAVLAGPLLYEPALCSK